MIQQGLMDWVRFCPVMCFLLLSPAQVTETYANSAGEADYVGFKSSPWVRFFNCEMRTIKIFMSKCVMSMREIMPGTF